MPNSVTMTTVFVRLIILLGLIPNLGLAHTFTESTIIAEWDYRYNAASQSYSAKPSVEPTIPGMPRSYIKEFKIKDYTKPAPILIETPFYDRTLNYAHLGTYQGLQSYSQYFRASIWQPVPITLSLKNDDGDSLDLMVSVMAIESAPAKPHKLVNPGGRMGFFDPQPDTSGNKFFLEQFSKYGKKEVRYRTLDGVKNNVDIKDQNIAIAYSAQPVSEYPKAGTYRYKGIMSIKNVFVKSAVVKPYVDFTVRIEPVIKATSPVRDIQFQFDTAQVKANKRVPILIQSNSDRLKLSVQCIPGYEHNTEGCLLRNIYATEYMLLTVQMDGKDIPNTKGFPQIINLIDTNPSYSKTKYAEIHLSEKENTGKPPKPGYYYGWIGLVFELEF
ncbi:hypothetical protein AB2M45_003304 [Vibrio cholerae]